MALSILRPDPITPVELSALPESVYDSISIPPLGHQSTSSDIIDHSVWLK